MPDPSERSGSKHQKGILLGLGAAVVLLFVVHVGLGSTSFLTPAVVVRELFAGPSADPSRENSIVWSIRLVQACGCLLIGGLLATVGSAFQALFRNPLAEPYTVGVSSGAAVGGVVAQVFGLGAVAAGLGVPLIAFVGGLLALLLVFALARRRGVVDVGTLLLAGVVVGALLSALLSLVLVLAGRDTNQLFRWLMGSTTPMFWNRVGIMLVVLAIGSVILYRQTRYLNAFAVGEDTAKQLGVDTSRLKWIVLVTGTAMAATAVGMSGVIPFLGLVAPHIARRLLGIDWRWSLIGSMLVGMGLILASDAVAQRGLPALSVAITGIEMTGTELPTGLVTALLGAPSLLILLRKTGNS